MKMMSRLGALCAMFAMVIACAGADAQICPASNAVNLEDIGDGCSTSYKGIDGSYFIADVAVYKGTFTPSCNHHDKCYTTLGTTYTQCDDTLLSEMRSACYSDYNPLLLPSVYTACMATAQTYYLGVKGLGAVKNPLPSYQRDAMSRSNHLFLGADPAGNVVNQRPASTCGTTPELTTLYDSSLIAQINSTYQTQAHRLPTIYEFMGLFTDNNFVDNRTVWNAALYQAAVTANMTPPPPTVTYTSTKTTTAVVFTASSATPGATYTWKLNGITLNQSSVPLFLHNPRYDTSWPVTGFVEVTDPTTGQRNMTLVNTFVVERGWCDAKDNHTQVCPRPGQV